MVKLLFFSIWIWFHPVHVTLTSIDYIEGRKVLKVFVKIYYDDFLLECKLEGRDVRDIDPSGNNSLSKYVIEKYINEKVIIKVNGQLLTGKLIDVNLADNELRMNIECYNVKRPGTISVKNLIMTDLYSDQTNMLIIKVDDFEQGFKLTAELKEQTLKI